jgi:hypothetical protein
VVREKKASMAMIEAWKRTTAQGCGSINTSEVAPMLRQDKASAVTKSRFCRMSV